MIRAIRAGLSCPVPGSTPLSIAHSCRVNGLHKQFDEMDLEKIYRMVSSGWGQRNAGLVRT
jgi:hypothetical protein